MVCSRGEVYSADLSQNIGSEQGGIRPVIVVQNNIGNNKSPTTIVVPVTSRFRKPLLPTHVKIKGDCLPKKSIALVEQMRTIDKSRIIERLGRVNKKSITKIDKAIGISVGCYRRSC